MSNFLNKGINSVADLYNRSESATIDLISGFASSLWSATKWVVATAVSIPKNVFYKAAHALPFLGLINVATLFAPPQVVAAAGAGVKAAPFLSKVLPGFVAAFFGANAANPAPMAKPVEVENTAPVNNNGEPIIALALEPLVETQETATDHSSYKKVVLETASAAGLVAGVSYFGSTLPTVVRTALTAPLATPQGFALNVAANSVVLGLGMYAPEATNKAWDSAKNAVSTAYASLPKMPRFRANS